MERGVIHLDGHGMAAACQFAVICKLNAKKLEAELRKRLDDWVTVRQDADYPNVRNVAFPMREQPLDGDLTIEAIMKCLDEIEQDVEQALRVTQLAEMVE